jgi:sterol desaturase/sphingolipid hydroxylase (fatty acid hydroxylase superfamily)
MPAIIDSAPSCITHVGGAKPADDSADFIIQAAYDKCTGFMTFGPGSTYGEDGSGAAGAYYVVTVLGILVMIAVLVYWVYWENRRLHSRRPIT